MSINWVELNPAKTPIPIGHERFQLPSGPGQLLETKLKLSSPISQTPRSEGYSGSGTVLEAAGTAYLSDMRKFVFVSSNGQLPVANSYSTFSVLFSGVLAVNYVQPWFGGNYIEVSFKPTAEGGLPLGAIATAQLRTDGRGLYEFYATMKQVMEVARKKQQEATTLPVYTPPRNDTNVVTPLAGPSATATHLLDTPNELPPAYST